MVQSTKLFSSKYNRVKLITSLSIIRTMKITTSMAADAVKDLDMVVLGEKEDDVSISACTP